jgi:D-amino-acid dehydrogenase
LRPDKLMQAWRRLLESGGVNIRENCRLLGFNAEVRLARNLTTNEGELAADQIVIATGAWTPTLKKWLHCPIPIQPGKGYSVTMPRPRLCPRLPMIFEEHRVAITPMQTGFRIGSTMEFAGYDDSLNPDRLRLLREGAEIYLRDPWAEPAAESWWGWRPMTPDSVPIIGPVPAYDNVHVAAGHGMLGVSMSPATGKLIAEMLTGQIPHLDPHPFRVR